MLETTQAIVLRVYPFSETSHVVSWLTPDHGRIATVVKGALRPRSVFLGQYDLFYTCDLVFYSRERGGVHIARECCPLKTRTALRTRWESAAFASYACDLASRVTLSGACQGSLYGVLDTVLDAAAEESPRPSLFFWYELHALDAIGLAPRIGPVCGGCGQTPPASSAWAYLPDRNGFLCAECGRVAAAADAAVGGPAGVQSPESPRFPAGMEGGRFDGRSSRAALIRIPADVVAMLRAWRATGDPGQAQRIVCTDDQALAFGLLFDTLFASLTDTAIASRALALDALAARSRW